VSDTTQYLTLGADREVFGVPVDYVREILDMRPVAHLPHAPEYLLGIIDVRGRSVPIVDLRCKLGLAPAETTANTRIVVLEIPLAGRETTLGLVADRVFEVTGLDSERIEAPPDIGTRWRSDYITGIGRRGDEFVIVFDLARLFAAEEAALVGGAAKQAA
jgi:purine-binding chemotaxis protein CheW